ncbi:MAG: trypsin-like peptidase domain-containing protein [Thermoguttaceae bacterium]|jgi:serine protease Do|nr:trypsin-like peptidase domain-containing protein [Thermoguttaceae bacterium]
MVGFCMFQPAQLCGRHLALVAACLGVGIAVCSARADDAAGVGVDTFLPASWQRPEERAELYRVLEQNAKVLEAQSAVVKAVARLVGPAVVHIEADAGPRPSLQLGSRKPQAEEAGSGVIVEYRGKFYVLTNRHVVRNSSAEGIRIYLQDGRMVSPTRVLGDEESDIGVMAISATRLMAAPIGDSERLEIGDFVLAVGSPFGLSQSVTFGIVSAKGRRDLRLGDARLRLQDFIQTDAAINPGNSGGPLVNLRGEVVGINTAIASASGGNEGIGFAIPIKMFMFTATQLIEKGRVDRAFLGVSLDSRFNSDDATAAGLPCPMGARVSAVTAGSPAATAGLRVGDIILQYGDTAVENDGHLVNMVAQTPVGETVELLFLRDRKQTSVDILLVQRK